ncbi:hypothetical protein [Nonomuraea recticatena]|uniref:hypothetical protein n=1 Tax=Nonomuraea recticatena TaxID=46178 RepID=UPI003621804A
MRAPGVAPDLEAHRHPVGQRGNVCDDADHAVLPRGEAFERGGDGVERGGVERAEPLVEEDRVEAARDGSRQREGQREGGLEGLAPDSVRALRRRPASPWSMTSMSPLPPSASSYCPSDSSRSVSEAVTTRSSRASAHSHLSKALALSSRVSSCATLASCSFSTARASSARARSRSSLTRSSLLSARATAVAIAPPICSGVACAATPI